MMSQVLQWTQLAKLMWICLPAGSPGGASTISYTAAGQKCWQGLPNSSHTTMVTNIRIANHQVHRLVILVTRARVVDVS